MSGNHTNYNHSFDPSSHHHDSQPPLFRSNNPFYSPHAAAAAPSDLVTPSHSPEGRSPLLASYDDPADRNMSSSKVTSTESLLSPAVQPLYRSGSPTPSSIDSHSPYTAAMNTPDGGLVPSSINSRGGYGPSATGAAGARPFGEKGWSAQPDASASMAPSISDKFSLSPDPASWGANVALNQPEADDYLHNPDPKRDRKSDRGGTIFTIRGLWNIGCIALLIMALVMLFAGYPLIIAFKEDEPNNFGAYNLGGINATGQVAARLGDYNLIDADTPPEAYTWKSMMSGDTWDLVFSDEFNKDGRTFWPGDDPFWEAENLHYWGTNNLEWYDPRAIITEGGNLKITLDTIPQRGLNYTGGIMSTWNKFCFRGGYVETSVSLPGRSDVYGLWPAVWTMGNLGRMGYGGTLDGMWPYSYDTCDVGTLPNQTYPTGELI